MIHESGMARGPESVEEMSKDEESGSVIDSTGWTGSRKPEWLDRSKLTGEELSGPVVFRHSDKGNDRRAISAYALVGFMVLLALGTLVAWSDVLSHISEAGNGTPRPKSVIAAIFGPLGLLYFGYLIYSRRENVRAAWSALAQRSTRVGDPILLIDDETFEDRRQRLGPVPWSMVDSIAVDWGGRRATLSIFLKHDVQERTPARKGRGPPSIVVSVPPMDVDGFHLANIMEHRRRAALARS